VSDPSLGGTDAGHGAQNAAGREDPLLTTRWLSAALIVAAALVLFAWTYLAVSHVDDRYRLDHVSGARMALAQYFDHGTLYPELYDGEFYGGTRFMPLPIVLHGLAARLTGEYLVAGKLLSYMATLGLLATMVLLLRRLRCPLPLALILTSLVLTTDTGLAGSMNMRADVLPLLLQVLAVGIVASAPRPTATVGAAALASLALFSKLSAVWAPIAILIWLVTRDRKRLVVFSGGYIIFSGVLFLMFVGVSDGRMLENVFGLSTSGITGLRSVLVAPYRFVHLMVGDATSAWAVVPLAILAAWIAARDRKSSLYIVSLVCASSVVLVVLTDVGAGWNQLIDLVVLTALVVGELAGRKIYLGRRRAATERLMAVGIGFILLWVTLSGSIVTLVPDVQATVTGAASYPNNPLAAVATARTSILSEDPYVPMSLGQVPLVLDPFMLPRLEERQSDAVPDLIRRIERHEFDLVVLIEPLEPVDRSWWSELDLGVPVARAISRAYAYAGSIHGYYLYEPLGSGEAGQPIYHV
jgi:hypothetical protein